MEEANPQILLWTIPEYPYRVTVAAPIINEIRILAVEAFYSVPRGGVEIGGVFFGTRTTDSLNIRAQRPITCQYASGPSFTLSVKDQLGLSGLLDQASTDPDLAGMSPLGWYHSHTRSEIFLSPADLQFYNDFFPDRWQIAMVLRPANLQPTRAGFFFRDRLGAVKSDAPLQIFALEPPLFGLTLLDPAPASDQPVVAEVPAPEPVKVLEPKAQPAGATFAERLALLQPSEPNPPPPASVPVEPHPALAAAVAAAVESGNHAVAATLAATTPVSLTPVSTGPAGIIAPAPMETPKAAQEATSPPAATSDAAPVDAEIPHFLSLAKPRKQRSFGWVWALAAIILACGAGGAAVLRWGKMAKPADLGLETYDINGAFLIRWDRESPVVRSATHATLEIQDGGEKTPFPLTPGELLAGGYGYIRRTGQVSVHLIVEGPTPAEEYSNFSTAQSLGSQPAPAAEKDSALAQAQTEKEHLKTELINESMQSLELRREITSLRRQLAEERAKKAAPAP